MNKIKSIINKININIYIILLEISVFIETLFWKFTKYLIRRKYGADCGVSDLDEYPELYKEPKSVFHSGRCSSCRAKEIIDWIDEHIKLLKM
jgi:hypothetical protein